MTDEVRPYHTPARYRHNKTGRVYVVLGSVVNATNSSADSLMVLYHPEGEPDNQFVRTYDEFHGIVDDEELRFEPIDDPTARPELGQAFFHDGGYPYEGSRLLMLTLLDIGEKISEYDLADHSPTDNMSESFECDVFSMHAHYWGEDEELIARPNFTWRGLKVRWYKHARRSLSTSRPVSLSEAEQLHTECMAALIRKAEQQDTGVKDDDRHPTAPVSPDQHGCPVTDL